ncbi:MAG: ribbon-helix-helix protein, CopG family [Thermofilaceae archaeon]
MPRPREIGPGEIISTKLSLRDAALLRSLARKEGVNVSKLVRRVLLEYIRKAYPDANPEAPIDSLPESEPDPLLEAERADFIDALEKLEKRVRELEYRAQPLFSAAAVGMRLSSEDYRLKLNLRNEAISLKKRWYELRRWYSHLPKDRSTSERMASLLRRLHTLEKLTS